MKKILVSLVLLGFWGSYSLFGDEMKVKNNDGKTVTIKGTLVDTNCFLKEGAVNDDHDNMKSCGRDCLKDGVPAGVLSGDSLYILIFPPSAFIDAVGKQVEITGDLYNGNQLIPNKAFVINKGEKKAIKLKGKTMM